MAAVLLIDLTIGDTFIRELPSEAATEETRALYLSFTIEGAAFGLAVACWLLGWLRWVRRIVCGFAALVTLGLLLRVVGLLFSLETETNASELLWDAGLLWANNVLIFSVWYWLVDGGGVEARQTGTRPADFAFPQHPRDLLGWRGWRPSYFDYLFLAFSHSTAFSPADTVVLSWRAKALIMVQAAVSLVILAMIAARAITVIQAGPTS
jgi:hypothetical protein